MDQYIDESRSQHHTFKVKHLNSGGNFDFIHFPDSCYALSMDDKRTAVDNTKRRDNVNVGEGKCGGFHVRIISFPSSEESEQLL